MSERTVTGEASPNDQALDEGLYERLVECGSFQVYELLNGDSAIRSEQKRLFIAGEIRNPDLDYPGLDVADLSELEGGLGALKHYLLTNEEHPAVKRAYRWKLNEKIAEVRLLKAAAGGDMSRFARYNDFVYGQPERDIFSYTVNSLRDKAISALETDNEDLRAAAEDLLAKLPEVSREGSLELPDEETIRIAAEQTLADLGYLIEDLPVDEKVGAEKIKEIFDGVLSKIGAEGWEAEIDESSSRSAISVDHQKMRVMIPKERKVKRDKLAQLILHEIGTHVLTRINGENSRLKLLGMGLDRYESGQEGITTMREQAYLGEVEDFARPAPFLAIALATGMDGQPRDFRDVYEVIKSYFVFENALSGKDIETAREKASNSAWDRCVRTFRGTDSNTPGVAFHKDLAYRTGNIGIWRLIKDKPALMNYFNSGKHNLSNERHIGILVELGIIDLDLT